MQNAARKFHYERSTKNQKLTLTSVDVHFDDTGFEQTQYAVNMGDTLHIQNEAMMSDRVTVYILSQDGQAPSNFLLGTVSKVEVSGGTFEDVVVKGKGTYMLSLDPSPQTLTATEPGGKRVTIIVSS